MSSASVFAVRRRHDQITRSPSSHKPKFHYADFPETSSSGEVGIVEFGQYTAPVPVVIESVDTVVLLSLFAVQVCC